MKHVFIFFCTKRKEWIRIRWKVFITSIWRELLLVTRMFIPEGLTPSGLINLTSYHFSSNFTWTIKKRRKKPPKLGGNFLARKTHKYAVFPLPWICTSNTSATIRSSYFPRDCLWQRRLILQPQYSDASDLHAGLAPLIYAQLECCFVGFSSFDVSVLASFWTAVNLIKSTTLLVWLFIAIARVSTSTSLDFGVMKRGPASAATTSNFCFPFVQTKKKKIKKVF